MELARFARESDPDYMAKIKEQKLRTQYGMTPMSSNTALVG